MHGNGGTNRARIDVAFMDDDISDITDWMQTERGWTQVLENPNQTCHYHGAVRRTSNTHVHIIYVRIVAADRSVKNYCRFL